MDLKVHEMFSLARTFVNALFLNTYLIFVLQMFLANRIYPSHASEYFPIACSKRTSLDKNDRENLRSVQKNTMNYRKQQGK